MSALGGDGGWSGERSYPPGDGLKLDWTQDDCERVARWSDDGHRLWVGSPHEWDASFDQENARRLALFVLRRELVVWFGLRRAIWYHALRKHLDATLPHRTSHWRRVEQRKRRQAALSDFDVSWDDPRPYQVTLRSRRREIEMWTR